MTITVKEFLRNKGKLIDIWQYIEDEGNIDKLDELVVELRLAAEDQVERLGLDPVTDLKNITFDVDWYYEGVEIDFKIERRETPKEKAKRLAKDKAVELRKLAKEAEQAEKRRAMYEELRKEFEQ